MRELSVHSSSVHAEPQCVCVCVCVRMCVRMCVGVGVGECVKMMGLGRNEGNKAK